MLGRVWAFEALKRLDSSPPPESKAFLGLSCPAAAPRLKKDSLALRAHVLRLLLLAMRPSITRSLAPHKRFSYPAKNFFFDPPECRGGRGFADRVAARILRLRPARPRAERAAPGACIAIRPLTFSPVKSLVRAIPGQPVQRAGARHRRSRNRFCRRRSNRCRRFHR